MDVESGIAYWKQSCVWRASWRPYAINNLVLSTVSYVPFMFLVYCAFKHPKTLSIYKRVVYVPALCQCAGLFPVYIFLIWFSIFVDADVPTTALSCTFAKTCLGTLAFSTFTAPVAVSACRYLNIVRNSHFAPSFLVLTIIMLSFPTHLISLLILFTGRPQNGAACTGLMVSSVDVSRVYNYIMILTMGVSFPLNFSVYRFVKNQAKMRSRSSTDELPVTLGLALQVTAPFLTYSILILYTSLVSSNVTIPLWAVVVLDSIAYIVPGLNIVVSVMFIKPYKQHFRNMFRMPFILALNSTLQAVQIGRQFLPLLNKLDPMHSYLKLQCLIHSKHYFGNFSQKLLPYVLMKILWNLFHSCIRRLEDV